MAVDKFEARRPGLESPCDMLRAVTPNDAADLPDGLTRCVFVGTGGTLAVVDRHGVEVAFANVADGSYHPIRVARVLATGTTATGIVALY